VEARLVQIHLSASEIETQMIELDMERDTEEETFVWNAERKRSEKVIKQAKGFCLFHAVVKDGVGGMATGTKSEKAASFTDFIKRLKRARLVALWRHSALARSSAAMSRRNLTESSMRP
jgi:hypothetical protein